MDEKNEDDAFSVLTKELAVTPSKDVDLPPFDLEKFRELCETHLDNHLPIRRRFQAARPRERMRPPMVPYALLPLRLEKGNQVVWSELPGFEEAEKQWARMMLDYMRYLHSQIGRADTITQVMKSIDSAVDNSASQGILGLDSAYLANVLRKYAGRSDVTRLEGGLNASDPRSAMLRAALSANAPV